MNADDFHRLVKLLADSGEASTLEEADRHFSAFGLTLDIGENGTLDEGRQIQALTILNCASRSFRGNVAIVGRDDIPLTVHGFAGTTLRSYLDRVAPTHPAPSPSWPTVSVNPACTDATSVIRPWAAGWTFGLGVPASNEPPTVSASVAAAGLAVSEAFSIMRGDNPYAGRRDMKLCLSETVAQLATDAAAIDERVPPLWLVGLGHLGQAYAWTIGFIPSQNNELVLQDIDETTVSTLSTSLVSLPSDVGRPKTEVVAEWLQVRGWRVRVVNRRFDHSQRTLPEDPATALFGVDNAAARRPMEGAGFRAIIDLGLGAGYQDFRGIRLRSFPGASSASEIWASEPIPRESQAPAYEALLRSNDDACGVAMLASRAVGAPFVGCVAAGLALAAVSLLAADAQVSSMVDLNLRDPGRLVRA